MQTTPLWHISWNYPNICLYELSKTIKSFVVSGFQAETQF